MLSEGNCRIGVDLVLISRIASLMNKEAWLKRVFTVQELGLMDNKAVRRQAEFLAGRFAVKEAFAKAVGTGIGARLGLQDVQTLYQETGAPVIHVSNRLQDTLSQELNLHQWEVSISHSPGERGSMGYAVAMVLLR
ncbi:MAG: holo-ACP synthase [Bacilli bacterium]|nr:holo-ACP synthase [Bacilli bacterium]